MNLSTSEIEVNLKLNFKPDKRTVIVSVSTFTMAILLFGAVG